MTRQKTHSATRDLTYRDGVLMWGGKKVTDIADELGSTPFYLYDKQRMTNRVAELRAVMPSQLHLHYAMKANPMPEVVRHMAGLVNGLDVASAGELRVAMTTGIDSKDISFAGPGKNDSELRDAVAAGITINMESESEMRRIAAIANERGVRPDVAIRVNPQFELKSAGMKMGGRPSPFGVDAERVPAMLSELKSLDLNFRGFHIYAGSQNLRNEAIDESMSKTVELVLELATTTDLNISFVNLGGGLGIPYFPNETPLDLERVGETAHRATEKLRRKLGEPEIIMELGRFLVGEAGIYVFKVLDVKDSRQSRYAICDGGLHHHLAASGNFGQVIRKNYPLVNVVESDSEKSEITVVGPLCTPLDLLGDRVDLYPVVPGDLLAILQSGAYGPSASPAAFLSHPPCNEILV